MRYRKDYGTVQTLRFDYLTKNKIFTTLLLLTWNLFLKYDSYYIIHETHQIWIYSDSHESNNLHVYMIDMIQRRLKINVTYISIPPYYGHNICNSCFARRKKKW